MASDRAVVTIAARMRTVGEVARSGVEGLRSLGEGVARTDLNARTRTVLGSRSIVTRVESAATRTFPWYTRAQ